MELRWVDGGGKIVEIGTTLAHIEKLISGTLNVTHSILLSIMSSEIAFSVLPIKSMVLKGERYLARKEGNNTKILFTFITDVL